MQMSWIVHIWRELRWVAHTVATILVLHSIVTLQPL